MFHVKHKPIKSAGRALSMPTIIKVICSGTNLQGFALNAARLSPLIQELLDIIQVRVQGSHFF